MTTDEIKRILQNFVPYGDDDLENDNESYLYDLTEKLQKNNDAENAFDDIFRLLENYPEADFGSPGPLVHTLELFRGKYETRLLDSLSRKPTTLTVWMLNRIINSASSSEREMYTGVMRDLLNDPQLKVNIHEAIIDFLKFQGAS
ncbi:hypothetical protein J0A67_16210 [Algoriphagus aestuariicola]|uniref:Immunity protein 30 domain-containing protein n=1 Tax=Algoriphagus aestuariicola TaxID=1852016 RepID=A0ABS3BTG8_9BACT|nr:hypothetical protein [Algoriphagus aestuariicola]MBN7802418.1 hypothetical protein [Algoriphagus aestuariicola]